MFDPIRILHVIGIMNRGGAETMIMNYYRHIDRNKVQFDFVENTDKVAVFDDEIKALGGRIYRCPHYNGKNHFVYVNWWKTFFKNHVDEYPIVHGHLGSTAAIYLSVTKKYGAYTIAHSHSAGGGSIMYRAFAYPTRYVADHFFACSRDAGISRYGKKAGSDVARCQVVNNAIDTRMFAFNSEKAQYIRNTLHIESDSLVVGHVGRFSPPKNHSYLIDIFAEVHKREPNSVLLLVGDGDGRKNIEKKVRSLGLEDSVIFTGVRSDVSDLLQAMDVFVFPSLYEGLGIVNIEAQAAGLPCFISDKVPKECIITDLVKSIPLGAPPKTWADEILSAKNVQRKNTGELIIKAGYDIEENAKRLQDYYMEQWKKCLH